MSLEKNMRPSSVISPVWIIFSESDLSRTPSFLLSYNHLWVLFFQVVLFTPSCLLFHLFHVSFFPDLTLFCTFSSFSPNMSVFRNQSWRMFVFDISRTRTAYDLRPVRSILSARISMWAVISPSCCRQTHTYITLYLVGATWETLTLFPFFPLNVLQFFSFGSLLTLSDKVVIDMINNTFLPYLTGYTPVTYCRYYSCPAAINQAENTFGVWIFRKYLNLMTVRVTWLTGQMLV